MKRRAAAGLLCLVFCISALTACGKDAVSSTDPETVTEFGSIPEDSPAEVPEASPTGSGTFSMPCNEAYGWDPYECLSMENQAVMDLIYEGLFTMNSQFEAEPVLCSEYTVNDTGLVYSLTIAEAYFSSGNRLTAEDVYYSMSKAKGSTLYSARFRDINSYEVTGLYTLNIYLNNVNDRLPCMLDFPIIPNFSATASPLGTGPFERTGTTMLTKNKYWAQGAENVSFNTVSLYSSASAEDTRDNFEIETVHFVYNDPCSASAATYHCDYELWASSGTIMQFLGFNQTAGICQDKTVRSGIIRAIDRAEIAETVYHNFASAATLPVSPASSMYDEDLARRFTYNRDEALSTLMSSGSFYLPEDHPVVTGAIFDDDYEAMEAPAEETEPDAPEEATETDPEEPPQEESGTDEAAPASTIAYNSITILVMAGSTHRSDAVDIVAENLTEVGFTVTVTEMEHDEFIYTLNNLPEEWDMFYMDVSLTPDFDLRNILYSGYTFNYGRIPADETLMSLYSSALENSGNRYDLYEYVMEQAYICPVLFQNNAVFTTRGVFKGLNPAPGNLFYGITDITVSN